MHKNVGWFIVAIWIILSGLIFVWLQQYGLPLPFVYVDTLVASTFTIAMLWIGLLLTRPYPTNAGACMYSSFIGVIVGLVVWYVDRSVLRLVFSNNEHILTFVSRSSFARLVISILIQTWASTLAYLWRKNERLNEQLIQISDASSMRRDAELFKLRNQLQPHFLYNSLNSVNALMLLDPDKAQSMIGKLSDFLRNSVKQESDEAVLFSNELNRIQTYLEIEAIRFGDRLEVVFDCEELESAMMPPFLLQPLLENAIKFGLYGQTGKVQISFSARLSDGYLTIMISNPYDAEFHPPKGTGFGLDGINRRLYLLYGRTDLLATTSADHTFITQIKIPQNYAQSNIDR
ncbi:MAG: histidine kinase [Bacteroidetes bacterium]|nr:histidine kinase [Bacteroidota bacterium]